MTAKRFSMVTLGCRVNRFESEGIARSLLNAGWHAAEESADLVVVNTCTVTGKAGMQSRGAIRRAIRKHETAVVVATGCHVQVFPEEAARIAGTDLVVGHGHKHNIPNIISDFGTNHPGGRQTSPGDSETIKSPVVLVSDISRETVFADFMPPGPLAGYSGEWSRPVVKVQDGCNARCAYCIIPRARGPSRGLPPGMVLTAARRFAAAGYPEIVLSGIHLGSYGADLTPPVSLTDLLGRLAGGIGGTGVRLSSIEPAETTDALIRTAAAIPGIRPHFHIPLQSGDDEILRRMNRPYTGAEYADRVFAVLNALPEAAVGTDVLVGFPGETAAAYENTLNLVQSLPLAYLHVFPYSPRPHTPAATFSDPVSPFEIKRRCRKLRRIGREKRLRFLSRYLSETVTVCVEGRTDPATGLFRGMTGNYISVCFEGKESDRSRTVPVKIERLTTDGRVLGRRR